MKLKLYTLESNKDIANQFLIEYLGEQYADSFGTAKTLNGETVYLFG